MTAHVPPEPPALSSTQGARAASPKATALKAVLFSIKANPEYQRIAKQGRRYSSSAFFVQAVASDPMSPLRCGLTASRKVGSAVVRNRAKRRLREIMRACAKAGAKGFDIVVVVKTAAATGDFAPMQAEMERILRQMGAMP